MKDVERYVGGKLPFQINDITSEKNQDSQGQRLEPTRKFQCKTLKPVSSKGI
jgi:hypothetical protein